MDGHHSASSDTIRYASDEDRRKAELLAASIDAAIEDFEQHGPATAADVALILKELEAEWMAAGSMKTARSG